jgi:hypothetical protein
MFGNKTRQIEDLATQVRDLRRENIALRRELGAAHALLSRWELRHVPAWITNALRDALNR